MCAAGHHLKSPCPTHLTTLPVQVSDLEMLEQAMESLASASDVRHLAMQQAVLAQSVNGMADWLAVRPDTADGVKGTGASATRFKCVRVDAGQ